MVTPEPWMKPRETSTEQVTLLTDWGTEALPGDYRRVSVDFACPKGHVSALQDELRGNEQVGGCFCYSCNTYYAPSDEIAGL